MVDSVTGVGEAHVPVDGSRPHPTVAVRTLLTGGFVLERSERNPGYMILYMTRVDELGVSHSYAFAIAEDRMTAAQVEAAKIAARHHNARLVLVARGEYDVPAVPWDRFVNLFGGPVFSASPIQPEFADQLIRLGHNELPPDLVGRPDDLFEEYVRAALEFVLGGRVVRYGQDRRFEKRPDGIAIPRSDFRALYDAKAYAEGYRVTAETIRQFKDYVEDFTRRYRAFLPRINAFVAISGNFLQGEKALEDRSRELLAECGVPLVFLTAKDLCEMIRIVADHPVARGSIPWARVFADPVVRPGRVKQEVEAIIQDRIIPGA